MNGALILLSGVGALSKKCLEKAQFDLFETARLFGLSFVTIA